MDVYKYIDWHAYWNNEICLQTARDYASANVVETIDKFLLDIDNSNLELMSDECFVDDDGWINIFFGESGGQNESDTVGWSRDYTFIFDEDSLLMYCSYSQG